LFQRFDLVICGRKIKIKIMCRKIKIKIMCRKIKVMTDRVCLGLTSPDHLACCGSLPCVCMADEVLEFKPPMFKK